MRSLTIVLCAALAGCGDNAHLSVVPVTSGDATLALSNDSSTLVLTRGDTTLLTFHADAFQVGVVDNLTSGDSFDPYWLLVDDPPPPPTGLTWRALAATDLMEVLSSSPTELVIGVADAVVSLRAAAPGAFLVHVAVRTAKPVGFLRVRPDADATEGFYGLGEWGDTVNHRGKLRAMQLEADATSESGDIENHVPVPLLIGTRGWGMFAESRRPGVFDVARATPTAIDVVFGTGEDSGAGLDVHLFTAAAPLDILAQYYTVAGAPGLPAEWAYGPLIWRDGNSNQAEMVDDITQIRSRHLATSGVWFDRPFATGVETFDFDPARYPAPTTMLEALHDAGFRYGVWQSPYTAPANNGEDPAGAQHDYAEAHHFFPPVTNLLVNQWGKPIDFTNPEAYAWWQSNLSMYTAPLPTGYGVEGFKLDYGEDIIVGVNGQRTKWLFADGSDERTMHYGYTLLYHQIHRELLPPEGGWLLTRTGRWGDQRKGMIIWPGDLDATFDKQGDLVAGKRAVGGLPTAVAYGIGLSVSGFPFYSSDTGGYRHSPANNECWLRWVEANAIGSAMEIGDSSSQTPWEFTPANGRNQHSLDVYKLYAALHLRLFPYTWSYAKAMATSGRPIVRPFGLAYPEVGQHPSDQFMFGEYLLSAPVVEAAKTARDVWFPPGAWLSWWDGTAYDGGARGAQLPVPADLDTLPLFIARGGIVPMLRPTAETLSPVPAGSPIDSFASDPGVLWVRIAPGTATTTFTLYDGSSVAQTGGTQLAFSAGSLFTHGALLEVIATPAPASVHAGGTALATRSSLAALELANDGWFWDVAMGGTLWIKVAGTATITVP